RCTIASSWRRASLWVTCFCAGAAARYGRRRRFVSRSDMEYRGGGEARSLGRAHLTDCDENFVRQRTEIGDLVRCRIEDFRRCHVENPKRRAAVADGEPIGFCRLAERNFN